jgi:hypothetical protein
VSKIHGPHDGAGVQDDWNDSAYADPAEYHAENAGVSSGAVSALAVLTQTLYLTEPGDTSAINIDDIHQGQLGDCFLLSSFGEIALLQPTFISKMIHANANGTETVALYEVGNGRLSGWNTTAFKSVSETVTNVFPTDAVNNGAGQDVVGNQKEIWPQVLEKAVATLDGGYSAIANGGSPVIAMEELTGHAASYMSPASLTLAALQAFIKAGDLIVMDTLPNGALPDSLVNNHAYMFESVSGSGASATVHLGNPWGFDQPAPILLSQLSRGVAEVDIGHFA